MALEIESFCDLSFGCNTYLVVNGNECIVIDPSSSVKTLKSFIGNKKLLGIFLTHGHYDHFMTLSILRKEFTCPLYLHKDAYKKINDPNLSCASLFRINKLDYIAIDNVIFVNEGSQIVFGNELIKVLSLPGHTNCSLAYKIGNNLFIGDVLFKESIGRYDLPTGNYLVTKNTIERIKKLRDDYIVYPGHDEVFTLKDAFKYNHYLK